MPRRKNPVPTYRRHPSKNQAIVDVYRHDGKRTRVYLPGLFDSPESKAEYARIVALLQAHGGRLPSRPGEVLPGDISIDCLLLRFLEEKVEVDYVHADGSPTTENLVYRHAVKPLSRLYGWSIAREFDARSLGVVREAMATGSWMTNEERERLTKNRKPIGWSRRNINKCVSRIRSMFRWATWQKIIPPTVVADLECLPTWKKGRAGVRETKDVVPVPTEDVDAILPFLPPIVADIVRLLVLTGARVGELCRLTTGTIDRTGPVWIYSPATHKTAHRGHARAIAFGPQSQMILRRYLKADPDAAMFSAAEQDAHIKAEKRRSRKTKVQPSQIDRSVPGAPRKPKDYFVPSAINRAIRRACERAKVKRFHTHQLRHTAALLVAREHGSEAARAVLGHRTINTTVFYAGIDTAKASDVALKMG